MNLRGFTEVCPLEFVIPKHVCVAWGIPNQLLALFDSNGLIFGVVGMDNDTIVSTLAIRDIIFIPQALIALPDSSSKVPFLVIPDRNQGPFHYLSIPLPLNGLPAHCGQLYSLVYDINLDAC